MSTVTHRFLRRHQWMGAVISNGCVIARVSVIMSVIMFVAVRYWLYQGIADVLRN
jgi:hypothetical protein